MAKYSLSTSLEEASFFSDYFLIAIGSPVKDFRFCRLLNRYLGLNLSRVLELDIPLLPPVSKKQKKPTLFDEFFAAEEPEEPVYFSVYKEDIPFSESSYILYNNRCRGRWLIPEQKKADFFLLLPFSGSLSPADWIRTFATIREIAWTRILDIDTLKSRVNLIF